jgi:hypothetical protein
MLRKTLTCVGGLAALWVGSFASAEVLYRNTSAFVDGAPIFVGDFSPFNPAGKTNVPVLDDGTFSGANTAYTLTSVNLGVYNPGSAVASVDLLVQFFDTATYRPFTDTSPVASTPIGPQFRFTLSLLPGADVTGPLALTGVTIPDNNYAIVTRLVTVGTETDDQNFNFLYKYAPVEIGSSDNIFAADWRTADGVIARNESLQWVPDANQFLEIDGTVAPEPGAVGLLLTLGVFLNGRRRSRRIIVSQK